MKNLIVAHSMCMRKENEYQPLKNIDEREILSGKFIKTEVKNEKL